MHVRVSPAHSGWSGSTRLDSPRNITRVEVRMCLPADVTIARVRIAVREHGEPQRRLVEGLRCLQS